MKFVNPAFNSAEVRHDRGGNVLLFPPEKLQSVFDGSAVTIAKVTPGADWSIAGTADKVPREIAKDTLRQSKRIYEQVTITGRKGAEDFQISTKDGFQTDAAKLTDEQLAKGGVRLADLLKKIWQ